ncbi:MAG: hypothetical protein JXB88_04670 [Spirochaetales bacterium]|nr:hypothetical protein [Spirochaetales bacterium]
MKIRMALLSIIVSLMAASCMTSTSVYWVPVYSLSFDDVPERTVFDPRINTIINPEEGLLTAYYETATKKGTAYGNNYSLSLAEKIVFTNDEVDREKSTSTFITNLELYKSFYFDYFRETREQKKLYVLRNNSLIALDHSLIQDFKIVEYVIFGKNTGTEPITEIVIADILPRGFEYEGSEYSLDAEKGSFEHKIITKNRRTSIILASRFVMPLQPAETFRLKIRLKANFDKMEKEFDY